MHLVAASWCIALPLRARQSARPTLASCCLDSVGATLLPLADRRETREECIAAYLGPAAAIYPPHLPIYLSLCCSRAAGRCFSFTVLPAVPAYLLLLLLLPTYYYHCYLILGLPLPPLLPIHHTPPSTLSLPPSALRADKVPRSHSTALAPCIGPARVNTAQSALDPDPLAFCSASRPLLHHQPTLRP